MVYQTGELEAKLQWLKEYQKSAEQESQFKGLLLDVEPYLLDEWDKDQMTLLNGYVTIMDEASRFAKEHELPFEMAIPFWFHELEKDGQPLLPFLTPLVDTFVIMSYRTELEGENGLHALVSPFFQQLPGNIVLTLETETLEGEERAISFAEKDYQQLNDFIRKLNNHYEQYESFQGVSVHHLDSWMKLMQQNEENR
ncbi:amidase [Halalkalibacter wakoensis JCM 9140]|uniref:Amidase n=1 Tax=Halalkalibacter wakoensis JCM 9140 TaxID=1236970 RepID=W4Q8D5_9BACI|nr:hypothetical protein [Halalkalibacter wakoensis]GAE28331.1 amidase [Halalkalibacter wakoensis JCM 9140]